MDDSIEGLNAARRLSYGAQLARRARKFPQERAIRFEGRDLSVGELDGNVSSQVIVRVLGPMFAS